MRFLDNKYYMMQRVPSTEKSPEGGSSHNTELDLISQPYYFDTISIENANEMLKALKKEGAFLIRKRTTGDIQTQPYALTVFYDNKIHHIRINRDSNGLFCCVKDVNDTKTKKFESIQEMIKYLDGNEKCSLKLSTKYNNLLEWYKTSPKSDDGTNDNNLDILPYFLKKISRDEIDQMLKVIRENEVFFIRKLTEKDQDTPQEVPYELAIYYKSYVYHLKIFKSLYEEYSVEFNDKSFDSIPDLVKYYNYEKLKCSGLSDVTIKLKIHSKYILTDNESI